MSGKVESFQNVRKSQELEVQSQEKSGFGFLWKGDEKLKLIKIQPSWFIRPLIAPEPQTFKSG